MFSFGVKKPTAEEAAAQKKAMTKEFSASLRKQIREIDREIRNHERNREKSKAEVAAAVKKNDISSARILGKNIIVQKRSIERLEICKARVQDLDRDVQNGDGVMKSVGVLDRMSRFVAVSNAKAEGEKSYASIGELQRMMMESGFIQQQAGEMLDGALAADNEPAAIEAEIQQLIAAEQAKLGKAAIGDAQHKVDARNGVVSGAAAAPAQQPVAAGGQVNWDSFDNAARGL